jgi:hypothetical protein
MLCCTSCSRESTQSVATQKQTTIYDTAVSVLQDFVHGGDFRLGFSDTTELANARIDTSQGIRINVLLEDSLIGGDLDTTSLIDVHRTIYPVYAKGSLRSAITFDSTPTGWGPVRFADAAHIRRYIDFHNHESGGRLKGHLVEIPSLDAEVYLTGLNNGMQSVVLSHEAHLRLKPYVPVNLRDSESIPKLDFQRALQSYLRDE